jgi:hypothetical protein
MTFPPSLWSTIGSPLLSCAPRLTDRHRSRPQADPMVGDDRGNDREHLGSRVDAGEFFGHLRRPHAAGGSIKHGTDGARSASGVGSLVARLRPTPDHATRALTSALSSVIPAVTSGIPSSWPG